MYFTNCCFKPHTIHTRGDRERGTAMQEGKKYSQVAGLIHAVVSQKYVASLSLLKITGTFCMQLAVDYHLIHLFGAIAHKHAAAQ